MPLLKGRFWTPVRAKMTPDGVDKTFKMDYTGEEFYCQEDYDKILLLYNEPLWTCQCTGHINMTHRDAFDSEEETRKEISEKFPEIYKKSVLSIVHHSTDTLEALTEKASMLIYENLFIGEEVIIKIMGGEKTISGTVTEKEKVTNSEKNGSASPSSDKENKEAPKSPSKSVPPKLSDDFKYTIKLQKSDRIVSGVPASDLSRSGRVPNKELIRVFIRCFAWRGGYSNTSPWVVQPAQVKLYDLKNKVADIFFSPKKIASDGKRAFEEALKEVQRNLSRTTSPRKAAANASPRKSSSSFKSPTGTTKSSPRKQLGLKRSNQSDESDSEEELSLAELKKRSPLKQSKSPSKRKVDSKSKQSSKKKRSKGEISDDDMALSQLQKKLKKSGKKSKSSFTDASGKKMKQATLFDMKARKGSSTDDTPKTPNGGSKLVSPLKKTPSYSQPPIVLKLQRALKKQLNNNAPIHLAFKCARELSAKQRAKLPDDVRDLIHQKWLKVEEKNKLAKMTAEEKAEYFKKKHKDRMKEQKHKQKKVEDSLLENSELPAPKLVPTPEGLPNEMFGDVAMVAEFISAYKGLLLPDEDLTLNSAVLMQALATEGRGFAYLNRVISILLQTLLQDDIASNYNELGVRLSDIGVNEYTCGELLRLCLRRLDPSDGHSEACSQDSDPGDCETVPGELVDELEGCELHTLSTEGKLLLLISLAHRVVNTYSVQDYMVERMNKASELWKERIKILKEKNDILKQEKEKRKQEKAIQKEKAEKALAKIEKPEDEGQVSLKKFYGGGAEARDSGVDEPLENADMASVVKRRRILAARAAEQRHVREREERMRRAKETEAQRREREVEQFEKTFQEGVSVAKLVQRVEPIGSDRNHNRYWVFNDCTPGLYVEKGWAWQDIDYRVGTFDLPDDASDSSSSESEDENEAAGDNKDTKAKKGKVKVEKCRDKTVPRLGQNLWFVYDAPADIELLRTRLDARGVRESRLLAQLKKHAPALIQRLEKSAKTGVEFEESKGTDDLIEGFREELRDMEQRIRAGGLGGVIQETVWEKRLETAVTISAFGELLKDVQDCILEKFLKGMLLKTGKLRKKTAQESPSTVKIKNESRSDSEDDSEVPAGGKKQDGCRAERVSPAPGEAATEDATSDEIVQLGRLEWRVAVDECRTWSRLHVLMGVLDSCVKWEKSAENAKCKVCRRKGDESGVLLCDECNGAFHMYCLRPTLFEIPPGDWYCPSCKPLAKRRVKHEPRYAESATAGSGDETSEELQHDTQCTVCEGEEDLILCSSCPSAFHKDCHEPPVRRTAPRSNWRCMQCLTGVRLRKKSRRAAAQKRKRYDDDFVEEWEEGYSEKPKPKRAKTGDEDVVDDPYSTHYKNDTSKSRAARYAQRVADPAPSAPDSEATEEEEDEEDEEETPKRGSSRRTQPAPRNAWNVVSSRSSSRYATTESENDEDTDSADFTPQREAPRPKKAKCEAHPKELLKINMDQILMRLRRNRHAWPFQDPVDPKMVPDYYEIVSRPMDLLTMRCKLECNEYTAAAQFVADLAQIFDNCELYNQPDSDVYKCILPLEKVVRESLNRFLPDTPYPRDQPSNKAQCNGTVEGEPLQVTNSGRRRVSGGSSGGGLKSPTANHVSQRGAAKSNGLMDHDYL